MPLEEQFKYLSDESTDSSDEEWTLGPKKNKKKNKNEPKSAGIWISFVRVIIVAVNPFSCHARTIFTR